VRTIRDDVFNICSVDFYSTSYESDRMIVSVKKKICGNVLSNLEFVHIVIETIILLWSSYVWFFNWANHEETIITWSSNGRPDIEMSEIWYRVSCRVRKMPMLFSWSILFLKDYMAEESFMQLSERSEAIHGSINTTCYNYARFTVKLYLTYLHRQWPVRQVGPIKKIIGRYPALSTNDFVSSRTTESFTSANACFDD
jgi:hypothetical protein